MDELAFIWLAELLGPASDRFLPLMQAFGAPAEMYERRQDPHFLSMLKGNRSQSKQMPTMDDAKRIAEQASALGVKTISFDSPFYPPLLREIARPPVLLYVTGNEQSLVTRSVSGVGSRFSTGYGREAVRYLSKPLVEAGLTLVSGLAHGIDTEVHKAALEGGGTTVAVLGTAIDRTYPAGHREIRRKIEQNGAVVSEYPPGTEGAAHFFPQRNRIIAGMSEVLVVFEAAKKSGSSITVSFALEEGREVFAVPGSILSPQSSGTNQLLSLGAQPALSAEDILSALGIPADPSREDRRTHPQTPVLTGLKREIYAILKESEQSIEGLSLRTGEPASALLACLTMLEMDGVVRSLPGQKYQLS